MTLPSMPVSKSTNPEIHESRKIIAMVGQLNQWIEFEWSMLHGSSPETVQLFKEEVIREFAGVPIAVINKSCPLFVNYMVEDCKMDVHQVDWVSMAIALDNLNGMYHPLRLTKIVLREQDD